MSILARLRPPITSEATTLRSPATWFLDWLGGGDTEAGVRAGESVAMGLSPYYCGLNMIASALSTIPLNVYKRSGKRRDVADAHPTQYLLHNEPNPEMSAASLRGSWAMHIVARGNAYGEIQRSADGSPYAIWPITPDRCRPVRDVENVLWYEVTMPSGEKRYLRRENCLHIPGLGYDGLIGYGLLQVAREAIGLSAAQDKYAARFFRNGGNISGTLETDQSLSDGAWQRLQKEIPTKLQGLDNAHRIALLEAGVKFKAINPNNREAQLLEARRFTVEEWARWLNMPPHKLKDLSHAHFNNVEQENIDWVVDTIRPWAVRFEQEFDRKLFRNYNQFYTKHIFEGLLRGDIKSRYEAYAIARNWGWFSANDVLELEDRNPLPGDTGDIYLIPSNMMRADEDPAAAAMPPPDPVEPDPVTANADRTVRMELRALSAAGRTGEAYDPEFISRVCEWNGVPQATAEHYVKVSKQLNLIGADQGIPREQVAIAKRGLLAALVKGDRK